MIPFKDDNPTSRFPFVTIAIIAVNIAVFIWEILSPLGEKYIVFKYGAVPSTLFTFKKAVSFSLHPGITVFSAMFLHGGFLHIIGNMLYLWIFGNNIEDALGHFRFLLFYLLCGIAAAYSHALISPSSTVPMIGASGAVAGILGAYILLFPKAKVHTVIFIIFFIEVVKIPALIVIGFWAIIQVVNGILSQGIPSQGGIAWFAHIGGFIAGILTIKLWLPRRRTQE